MQKERKFKLKSPFAPAGDQPQAIEKLVKNLKAGAKHQVFLGVTGSGKTFVMANVISRFQKAALIIEPNKSLAAQTYQEFKEFFPSAPIHYFVSYYDYYQPEAYIPQTDTYIEKDAKINEEIDRLRHFAVQDLLSSKKAIIVASVSCIYNLGSPINYQKIALEIKPGQKISRRDFIGQLISLQYLRNDIDFKPSTFRVRGEIIEIFLVSGEKILKIEFSGDGIRRLSVSPPSFNTKYQILDTQYSLYPAKFWVAPEDKLKISIQNIKSELVDRLAFLKKQQKLLEAERLEQRTNFDLQMIAETGYCSGVENYSRHLEFREPKTAPFTLLDYFALADSNFLVFIDESHLTCPQIGAMSVQDKIRKQVLIDYGFRLPSAIDNRPLNYPEFEQKSPQITYISATPNSFEKRKATTHFVEQLVRPTGLLEPKIEIRPTKHQIQDLLKEIKKGAKNLQRTLVITLTKRLAEDLADFLKDNGVRAFWLHSETKTLERPQILKKLREGTFDALVGVNLLREGLDLPEVSLVAILDADKEGFLRSETTLIQTMGRAARHLEGRVILYADKITKSMNLAMNEIKRRRKIQLAHNRKYKIIPKQVVKKIRDWSFGQKEKEVELEFMAAHDINLLQDEMKQAAANLDFERATRIRDLITEYKNAT
jgi:excinuclease ABC subunit B